MSGLVQRMNREEGALHVVGFGVLLLVLAGSWLLLTTFGRVSRVDEQNQELRHRVDMLELRVKNLELRP